MSSGNNKKIPYSKSENERMSPLETRQSCNTKTDRAAKDANDTSKSDDASQSNDNRVILEAINSIKAEVTIW